MLARAEGGHARADAFHHPDAFVPEDPPRLAGRHITLEDMQIGSADRRLQDAYDGVAGPLDHGRRPLFQGLAARLLIDERLHQNLLQPPARPRKTPSGLRLRESLGAKHGFS